jgi:hypothetical protein
MNRQVLEQRLVKAERFVHLADKHLEELRARLDRLRQSGHDARDTETLIATFEKTRRPHMNDCEQLRKALSALAAPDSSGPTRAA